MVKISPDITYIEYYATLRCNLGCSYCINKVGTLEKTYIERSAAEVTEAFNNIDFGKLPLTIGGGEPTVKKDFYELVHGLGKHIKIDLLTNLQFDPIDFIINLSPSQFSTQGDGEYKSIRVSYHPEQMDPHELVKKVKIIQDRNFSIGIFGISHPENIGANIKMSEIARKNNVFFFIKEFLGYYNDHLFGFYRYPFAVNGNQKTVSCLSTELLINPAGDIFKCHRDLYANEFPIGSIFKQGSALIPEFRVCHNCGDCNFCDIKHKVGHQLSGSNCSVIINE